MSYMAGIKLKVVERALKHLETAQLGGTSVLAQCLYAYWRKQEVWAINRDHRVFRGPKEGKFPGAEKSF